MLYSLTGCSQKGSDLRLQIRPYLLVMLAVLFILALAAPAIAQDDTRLNHTINYKIGGLINITRELGHACTTGAVKRQTIYGYGDVTKSESVRIAANIIAIEEVMDWSTAADAKGKLTVTTVIDLCARPMSAVARTYEVSPGVFAYKDDIIHTYLPDVVNGNIDVYGLTKQLWVTSVSTYPGNNGSYHSDFVAAYGPGPYEALFGAIDPDGNKFFYDEEYMWEYKDGVNPSDRDSKTKGYERGDYYVGNYFTIEQYAYTSGGELRRFIDMSSPFTSTYLSEDLAVTGMASVKESFEMHNLEGGPKAITLAWYDLF